MNFFYRFAFATFCLLFLLNKNSSAQYEFIAPLNGSQYHAINRNIIIRPGALLNVTSIKKSAFSIVGSKSGKHDFGIIISDDEKTILLQPFSPFDYGEEVNVKVSSSLKDMNGNTIPPNSFCFFTQQKFTPEQEAQIKAAMNHSQDLPIDTMQTETPAVQTSKPYTILINKNAAPGQIFFSTYSGLSLSKPKHLWIIDNNGDSVFSQKTPYRTYDFKINHIGYPTVFDTRLQSFDVLDSNFVKIAHFHCQNSVFTDDHDFQIFADHRSFLVGDQFVIMSVKPNDSTPPHNAFVTENVIQELDGNNNVVFEWRSIDHMSVNEAWHQNLFAGFIDAVHLNAVERDTDGNILISCRNLDQIDKIDVKTGNFIWRLGGMKNEFIFVNDTARFNGQHDIRRLSNGHITLFDNGTFSNPPHSFAKEYALDEVNKTATLVWSYSHPFVNGNPVSSFALGNVQRLPNGNTLINWGWIPYNSGFPNVTEVDAGGNITWEMQCDPGDWNIIYRAYKFEWNPCARPSTRKMKATSLNDSSVQFSWNQSSGALKYLIQYRKEGSGFWNDLNANANQFSITTDHLIPGSHYEWRMQTWCDTTGNIHSGYTDKLFFNVGESRISSDKNNFSVYPNPAKNKVCISWQEQLPWPVFTVEITDQLGNILITKSEKSSNYPEQIPVSRLRSGIYFIRLIAGETVFIRTFAKID